MSVYHFVSHWSQAGRSWWVNEGCGPWRTLLKRMTPKYVSARKSRRVRRKTERGSRKDPPILSRRYGASAATIGTVPAIHTAWTPDVEVRAATNCDSPGSSVTCV